MKVFGLHGSIYRVARLASRLETISGNPTAAQRRDILSRWQTARRRGLSASEAAEAVGAARATLYRRLERPEPCSRRPHRHRHTTWRGTSLVSDVNRHAKRLPRDLKPSEPGELVQVDTLFVNVAPDKPIEHFTTYDPVAKWTTVLVAGRATARLAAVFWRN